MTKLIFSSNLPVLLNPTEFQNLLTCCQLWRCWIHRWMGNKYWHESGMTWNWWEIGWWLRMRLSFKNIAINRQIGDELSPLTFPPFPLEIHVAPFPVIDLLVAGLQLCFPRAHINQEVQVPVQQLHGEVISLQLPTGLLLFGTLRTAVAEQQEAAGLCGAEVKRYGARLLCVPPGQCQVGRRRVEGDRLQGFHILAAEYQVTMDTDPRVSLFCQLWQFQPKLIILVDHLIKDRYAVVRGKAWESNKFIAKVEYYSSINTNIDIKQQQTTHWSMNPPELCHITWHI